MNAVSTKTLASFVATLIAIAASDSALAQETKTSNQLKVLFSDDFSGDADAWQMMDPESWKYKSDGDKKVLSLFDKKSTYQPPVRSPLHIALLKTPTVGSFQMDVKILSTHEDYNHRDVCLFFGYQGPSEFYYVHLGKKADPHANQIFIVNKKPRTKISLTTTDGTPWDDQWHHVRIIRAAESGDIKVFFDNLYEPVMTANDKTFKTGRVGLGSFDDTADFDDFNLSAKDASKD